MGYFGYFGDPTTDGTLPPTTNPSQVPGGTPTPPPSGLPGSSPYGSGTSQLPGSGTPQLPGSSSSGLQPYPGTSSSSSLPGMPVSGGGLVPLPAGQPWASAPAVRALAGSLTNGALFTAPNGQKAAWVQLVLRQMIGAGYFDPGNSAAAVGAIGALSQAYGYFMQMQLAPNDPSIQVMGGTGALAIGYSALMINVLSDAYAATQYWQSTPAYQKIANAPPPLNIDPSFLYKLAARDAAQAQAAAAAATPAASSKTLMYVGLAGAAGLAAYLAFA